MELHRIAVRALFVYLFLLALVRLSGKRTVAQSTAFSFVFALILGDLIDDALWAEVPAAQFVVGAGTLGVLQLLASWAAARSEWFERFVCGPPEAVVVDGRKQRRGMRAERLGDRELAFEMRQRGIDAEEWNGVAAAFIEANGALSVLRTPGARPVPRRDAAALRRRRAR